MMLARVADSLYWMGRYVERAEHVCRLADVTLNATLDRSMAANETARIALSAPSRVVNSGAGVGNRASAGSRTSYTVTGVGGVTTSSRISLTRSM